MALDDLAHFHATWPAYSAGGRIHLGRLTGYDIADVTRSARSALAGVLARA
jgi:hypothetical protein